MSYGEDLTYIHDAGHGDLARAAAATLIELLRRSGKSGGRVVDLGCGSGILAEAVSAAGYEVSGFDLSAAMIETARRRAPAADLRVGSFLDAELPPCVAVTAVGECFSYLFDEGVVAGGLDRLFARIHGALERGGFLLFDVVAPGRVRGTSPQRSWREGDDWAVLVEVDEDAGARRLTRSITTFRALPGDERTLWRRDHEVHRQVLHERRELEPRLRAVGFRVRPIAGYGELRFGPGQIGFCARRRATGSAPS